MEPAEAEREVSIDPEAAKRIDAMVSTFVGSLRSIDVHGDDYRRRVDDIDSLADREIRSTSDMSNRLLDRPAARDARSRPAVTHRSRRACSISAAPSTSSTRPSTT